MHDVRELALSNRKSVKRAIARFCVVKHIDLREEDFLVLVRRTQESGYTSAIKFLSTYFDTTKTSIRDKKQFLLQFTIEYNTETYCRQFPKGNESVKRILTGQRTIDDDVFFKKFLYECVKANKLQLQVIEKYI